MTQPTNHEPDSACVQKFLSQRFCWCLPTLVVSMPCMSMSGELAPFPEARARRIFGPPSLGTARRRPARAHIACPPLFGIVGDGGEPGEGPAHSPLRKRRQRKRPAAVAAGTRKENAPLAPPLPPPFDVKRLHRQHPPTWRANVPLPSWPPAVPNFMQQNLELDPKRAV